MSAPEITIVGSKLCLPDEAQIESNEWSHKIIMRATREFITKLPGLIESVITAYTHIDSARAVRAHRDALQNITILRVHDWATPAYDLDISIAIPGVIGTIDLSEPLARLMSEFFEHQLRQTRRALTPIRYRIRFCGDGVQGSIINAPQKVH